MACQWFAGLAAVFARWLMGGNMMRFPTVLHPATFPHSIQQCSLAHDPPPRPLKTRQNRSLWRLPVGCHPRIIPRGLAQDLPDDKTNRMTRAIGHGDNVIQNELEVVASQPPKLDPE